MSRLSLALFLFASFAYANPSAEEIVKKADRMRLPGGSLSFEVTIEDFRSERVVTSTTYSVQKASETKGLVNTISPERQRGRKLLMVEDDLWLYTPTTKRPTRVTFQQRLTGDISNGDIAKTDFSGDYKAEFLGEDKLDGEPVYKLKLKAKRKTVTYHSINYWVKKSDQSPVRAEFLTVSGRALKRATYARAQEVLGHPALTQIKMEDLLTKGKYSVMTYNRFRRENFDESVFSKESLVD